VIRLSHRGTFVTHLILVIASADSQFGLGRAITVKSNPWTALLHEKRTKTAYNSGDGTWMSTCLTDGGAGSSVPPPCSQGDCPRCDAKTCNLIYRHGGDACVTAPVSIDELTMRLNRISVARPASVLGLNVAMGVGECTENATISVPRKPCGV
jgi:hypothetical protein